MSDYSDDSDRTLSQTLDDTRSQDSKASSGRSTKDSLRAAGSSLRSFGQDESDRADSDSRNIHAVSYKRGGRVKKTGLARVHKGEYVVPRGKVKRVKKAIRKMGRKAGRS